MVSAGVGCGQPNRDRQIYPTISPGLDPGTTTLELKVKDRLPLHGRIEVNDKSSPGTPLLRLDTALQYGNLWQREHQIGVDYNFSPQKFKPDDSVHGFYDLPLITSYSAFYRLPLGGAANLREHVEQQPATFGLDEVSHKFNLPPPTGRPDLTVYASRSVSATPVRYGPLAVIFTNTLADISSQFGQQSFTINNNLGGKLNVPVREFGGIHSALSFGADFKTYEAPTFSTNLTYSRFVRARHVGQPVLVDQPNRVSAGQQPDGIVLHSTVLGLDGRATGPIRRFWLHLFPKPFLGTARLGPHQFSSRRRSARRRGNYTTINTGLTREQKLIGEWSRLAQCQWPMGQRAAHQQRTIRASAAPAACAVTNRAKFTATPAGGACSISARRPSWRDISPRRKGLCPLNCAFRGSWTTARPLD